MTITGTRTSRPRSRSARAPVVVARVVLPVGATAPVQAVSGTLTSRRELHVARRRRRRGALLGLGVIAASVAATVAVLDVFH
ncbi:MAG: hypothetical protein ACRDVP_03620 [Acidimicrobiales bacterium]